MKLPTIKKRKDFVLSNKFGYKIFNKNFILQKYNQNEQKEPSLKFGFTATKRIGNAVHRNRAKRRMRALISLFLKENRLLFDHTSSYVLVAKKSLVKASFFDLKTEMKECLNKS
ncbi:MAG: ribonuclease P protein component [Candidatus Puniceispirillales bacterium]|jgi:ribonuclease P protein component|nr:ribonuclease P protein component [Alphaproteobacteria bacterium]MBL6850589.1 ribonuclease P protein component [Alphaproteobacteria bacterium]